MIMLLNNNAGIVKKINKYPVTDSMTSDNGTYINFNPSHSYALIPDMSVIKLISVNRNLKMLTMM